MAHLIRNPDAIAGLVILLFCGIGLFLVQDVKGAPSAFPIATLSGMGLLALVLIGEALREATRRGNTLIGHESEPTDDTATGAGPETGRAENDTKPRATPDSPHIIFGMLLITAIYIGALDILGFVVSTPIYIYAMLFFLGMRRHGLMILLSALTVAIVFLFLRTVMYISLPGGIFDPTELIYQLFKN